MKSYLLDTNIFLWAIKNSPRLPSRARTILERGDNIVFVSAVTPWEIGIKRSIGKLRIPPIQYEIEMKNYRFQHLDVRFEHGEAVEHLPLHHRDPFDRLLIAQAITDGLTLISSDTIFDAYDVKLVR